MVLFLMNLQILNLPALRISVVYLIRLTVHWVSGVDFKESSTYKSWQVLDQTGFYCQLQS